MHRVNLFLSFVLFGVPPCAATDGQRRRVGLSEAWQLAGTLGHRPDLPCVKPWWHSKTIWVNGIVLTMAAVETNIQSLQGLIPENTLKLLVFLLPIVNIWLRSGSSQILSFRKRDQASTGEQP